MGAKPVFVDLAVTGFRRGLWGNVIEPEPTINRLTRYFEYSACFDLTSAFCYKG